MVYTFKIQTHVDPDWNKHLLKSKTASFFQSSYYLTSGSKNFFPIYVCILDESGNMVGQLGISIIKTTVLYSSSFFQTVLRIIANLSTRGVWLYGPIIHSDDKKKRLEILEQIILATDVICQKYNLVFLEGYTSPYDLLVDDAYLKSFTGRGYILSDYVTFMADLSKPIEQIWNDVSKKARGDVNRAKRRGIITKEVQTIDDLKKFLMLHKTWAKTKGLEISNPFRDVEKLWNNHKFGVEKFFLAYQKDKLISGLRISCFNDIACTHFVISSYSESTSLGGTFLTWYSIEWAKTAGLRFYDFSGGSKSSFNKQDTLLFYKKKWGGNEYSYYHVIKVQKKLHYVIYKFLFGVVRSYHNLKSRREPLKR